MAWLACLALVLLPTPAWSDSFEEDLRFDDTPRHIGLHTPDWFELSFLDLREDLEDAVAEGKMGLAVYFGMDDCPYCEALFDKNFAQDDIRDYLASHFNVVAIDALGTREVTDLDGETWMERRYAAEQRLNFTPSIAFYDEDGERIHQMRGYYPPYRFRALLEYVIDRHDRDMSFRTYLERANPPPKFDLDDINERDFFVNPPYALDRSRIPADRPLVVFFEREACHACDILHSEPLQQDEVLERIALIDAVQLDADDADTPVLTPAGERTNPKEWAARLDVHWAPTLIFFDEQGEEIIRIDSVVHLNRLRNVMDYVLTRGYEDYPTFERWRAQQPPRP
ncbi:MULTISPECIES: thioredoxin fold domain-containing protein [unclassified Thioalkalivibrio]|uniref:thioredoxin family protein n=1 Tax=unclassified Thioalkalivibrio TaxID=2621013 RepID=UPI0004772B31|nr:MULTISPECIES: thioredoxin fold domain-containing protein [unclassified Thioalkalivibrio]